MHSGLIVIPADERMPTSKESRRKREIEEARANHEERECGQRERERERERDNLNKSTSSTSLIAHEIEFQHEFRPTFCTNVLDSMNPV